MQQLNQTIDNNTEKITIQTPDKNCSGIKLNSDNNNYLLLNGHTASSSLSESDEFLHNIKRELQDCQKNENFCNDTDDIDNNKSINVETSNDENLTDLNKKPI